MVVLTVTLIGVLVVVEVVLVVVGVGWGRLLSLWDAMGAVQE